jgi:DNA-binding transcriptional regulator PaaX
VRHDRAGLRSIFDAMRANFAQLDQAFQDGFVRLSERDAAVTNVAADKMAETQAKILSANSHLLEIAKTIYQARRAREKVMPSSLFGEPAYDILLDAFISREEKRDISVSSACVAAAVSPTTALRWVVRLEQLGYFVRARDVEDGRRVWLRLTDSGHSNVIRMLEAQQAVYPLKQ